MNKIISLYLIFFILINPVYVFSSTYENNSTVTPSPMSENSIDITVQNNETELIIIIDAHENIQAQRNIAELIKKINGVSPLSAVFIEGAGGEVNPDKYFRILDNDKISFSVFNYLLKKGFITGSEYWKLSSDSKTPLKGAENPVDYRDNLNHLIKLKQLSAKDSVLPLINILNNQLRFNLPENLAELDEQYLSMIIDGKDVLNFIYPLIKDYADEISANRGKYTILSKFLMFSHKSSKINSDLIQAISEIQEKNGLDDNIVKKANVLKKQLIFGNGQLNSLHEPIEFIYEHKNELDKFLLNRIISYYANAKFINSLSPSKMYLSILKEYKSLFCSVSDKNNLFQTRDSLLGLYKGCNINLTSTEFYYFNIDEINPEYFLNTFLSLEKSSDFILDEIVKPKRIEQIYRIKQTVCDFYHAVEQRNNSILDNIYKNLPDGKKAVLVIGGYHKNICEQIEQRGIKVTVVTPEVKFLEKNPRDVSYSDYLSGKFTELEKMIYYSWSTIVSPIVSQDINRFSNKQEAIPTIVSRQIALMIGTSLIINQKIAENSSRESINSEIANILKQAASSNYDINDSFSKLDGLENEPQWPQVSEFVQIANKNGIFVTFKIGNKLLGLQLMKQGAILADTEKEGIDAVRQGHVTEESINFDGNVYTLSLFNITVPYKNTPSITEQNSNPVQEIKSKTGHNYLIELFSPFIINTKFIPGDTEIKNIENSFEDKINHAVSNKDLDELYDVYDYFENIITSRAAVISYLGSLGNLTDEQMSLIQKHADAVIDAAVFYRIYVELKIADLGGELRGFKFLKHLGSGAWGNVYLAEKDGRKWAVKLLRLTPFMSPKRFPEGKQKHLKEAVLTISVYDDVYTGYCGQFNKGENFFIAVPYENTGTLSNKRLPEDTNSLIKTAVSLAREMTKVEEKGIVFNDLKPENILVNDTGDSVRIIDFGCAFNEKLPPKTIDNITIGSTRPYRSPELQTLTEIIDALEIEFGIANSTPIEDINFDFLERIEYLLRKGLPYINDTDTYNRLIYPIIPVCYAKLNNGSFSSVQELIGMFEKDLLACLFSMVDHRSDIYSFGIILRDDIFKDLSNPAINKIIDKACAEDPNSRYGSFRELFDDLNNVSNLENGLEHEKAIAAHFIGERPEFDMNKLEKTVQSWEKYPFNNKMHDEVMAVSEYLSFSLPAMREILQRTLKPKTYSPDGNAAAFKDIIDNLAAQLKSMRGQQDYLEFNVDSEPRPVRIHLVSYSNLQEIGVSGLTIPSDNRIDIYLPADLFPTRQEIFLQIFKHELDEYIFKLPHTKAVLLEPLIHHYGYIRLGKASRRTLFEFKKRIDSAYINKDLNALYSLKDEMKSLIDNEEREINSIEQNTSLSEEEKKFAKRLAEDISHEAKFFSFQIDSYIARLGGTLHGFKFIDKLGSGAWGTVYLAVKDDKLWAVKLLNVQRDKKTLLLSDRADISIEMHKNEIELTDYAYSDVYRGNTGSFDEGDNRFIAVPFFEGETLSKRFSALSNQETELIDTTLSIIKELIELETKGIVFNDFNPNNIYFSAQTNQVRFIDFGCAMRSGSSPDKLSKVTIGATNPFISPEFQICRKLRANLASVFDLLLSTQFEKIQDEFPDIFQVFLSQALHAGADKNIYNEIKNNLFVTASKKIQNGEIKSQRELINFIEPRLVNFILSLIDIRSDIFAFGKLLEHEVFIDDLSPEISRIIKKAVSHHPDDRYQSFRDLYADIISYRKSIEPDFSDTLKNNSQNISNKQSITAHFIGVTPTLNTEYIENLKPMPITRTMLPNLKNYNDYLFDRYETIKSIAYSTLYPEDKSADGGFSRFNTILSNFADVLSKSDDTQNSLTLSIPGEPRPVIIYLISLNQLNQAGVSALTVPRDDSINMYLPYDYFNVSSITTFLEIFKHEIDEFVFSVPHTLSVLQESLFTAESPNNIGTASERVKNEFTSRFKQAFNSNNLNELYALSGYFKDLIRNESDVKSEILANDNLTPVQQQYAIKLAEDITRLSVYFSIRLENAIAGAQGTLRGYKFLSKFTETETYTIYTARKNNNLFFVKILKPEIDNINQLAVSQIDESNLINSVYADVHENVSGSVTEGETPVYAVPFSEGKMLNEIVLPESETGLSQTAVLIAEHIEQLEEKNIISNMIFPKTIFINEKMDSARIFNFTGSLNFNNLPLKIDDFNIPEPTKYHSPEYVILYNDLQKLKSIAFEINQATIEKMDKKIFDEIKSVLDNLYDLSNQKHIYDKLVTETIPNIILALENGEIRTPTQINDLIMPDIITFMAGSIDSRSDIYSFGIMLANDLFANVTDIEINNIITRTIHPDRNKRYRNFTEVRNALITYISNINTFPEKQRIKSENVAFGTISESDHRRIGGLNGKIRRLFTKKINPENIIEEFELIQTQILLWNYDTVKNNNKINAILERIGITNNSQWDNFIKTLTERLKNANVYFLPADSFMLWIGSRFSAAHYGRYNHRDNIYLTSPLTRIMEPHETAVVILHEMLHIMGFFHEDAELFLTAVIPDANTYEEIKEFIYLIAELESTPALRKHGGKNFRRLISTISPVLKKAVANKKVLSKNNFSLILKKLNFEPAFIDLAYEKINSALIRNSQGESPSKTMESNLSNKVLDVSQNRIHLLISRLTHQDTLRSLDAIDELIGIGEPAVTVLTKSLTSQNTIKLKNILYILGELNNPSVFEQISLLFSHQSPDVRESAFNTASKLIRPNHASYLHNMLTKTDSSEILAGLINLLEQIGQTPNMDNIHFITNPNSEIRALAAKILDRQGIDRSKEIQSAGEVWTAVNNLSKIDDTTHFNEALNKLRSLGKQALPYLRLSAQWDNADTAAWSALLLAEQEDLSAVKPLLKIMLNSPGTKKDKAVSFLLSDIYEDELIKLIQSESSVLTDKAIEILKEKQSIRAVPFFQRIVLDRENYSISNRLSALKALSELSDEKDLSLIINELVHEITKPLDRAFDDKLVLLEIAVIVKNRNLRKSSESLRIILREQSINLKKAAIEGLGVVGKYSDISTIQLFARLYPELIPEAKEATANLNGLDKYLASIIGLFLAGEPNENHVSIDGNIHKNELIGVEEIINFSDFKIIPFSIKTGLDTFSFTIHADKDFTNKKHINSISSAEITEILTAILKNNIDVCRGLHGKKIYLSLLDNSYRLSESHLSDSFIGFNEALLAIADKEHLKTLISVLLLHELKHEAGIAPVEGGQLLYFEQSEVIKTAETLYKTFPDKTDFNRFITSITPIFAEKSFFIHVLRSLANETISLSDLKVIYKLNIANPSNQIAEDFYREIINPQPDLFDIRNRLSQLGLLSQDIARLLALSPESHLKGDFEELNSLSPFIKHAMHDIILEGYLRKLTPHLIKLENTASVFDLFLNSYEETTPGARGKIDSYKEQITHYKKMRVLSDSEFIEILAADLIYSKFTGKNEGFFINPEFAQLIPHIEYALADSRIIKSLSGKEKVSFIEQLFSLSRSYAIPIGLNIEPEPSESNLFKVNLDKSAGSAIETSM